MMPKAQIKTCCGDISAGHLEDMTYLRIPGAGLPRLQSGLHADAGIAYFQHPLM